MPQAADTDVLVVCVDEERMALPLESVLEILPAMQSESLPGAPPVVSGVVNLRGEPVPLLSLRARLGLPAVGCHPDHHVVLCSVGERRLALWVDRAESVTSLDPKTVVASDGVVATRYFEGIAVLSDGVMFVFDLRSFLDADEILQLDTAMAAIAKPTAVNAPGFDRAARHLVAMVKALSDVKVIRRRVYEPSTATRAPHRHRRVVAVAAYTGGPPPCASSCRNFPRLCRSPSSSNTSF